MYLLTDSRERLGSALIVYGTLSEAGANRYAAEELQKRFYRALEAQVPVRKDFELTEADLAAHDVIFVGRPETNSALSAWQRRTRPRLRGRSVPHRWPGSRLRN